MSRQANLHWKAALIASTRRSPSPPLLLGVQIDSQAIRGSPEEAEEEFQRKLR